MVGLADPALRAVATVTTGYALSESQVSSVKELLYRKLRRPVDLVVNVDPTLIGGIQIYVEGHLIDHTIKRRLKDIKSGVAEFENQDISYDEVEDLILREISEQKKEPEIVETGVVIQVGDCIATVSGLENAMSGELLEFDNGVFGIVMNLNKDSVGVVLMGPDAGIREGDFVKLTGRVAEVPAGDALIGRVVDALGEPIDQKGPLNNTKARMIERIAPGVIERQDVSVPLQTGVKAIDAMIPIGRGQRELIIGDRQTGKTTLCIDTILNQKGKDVLCVYVAIGQKASTVARIVKTLDEMGAMEYSTVVVSTASDPMSLQYLSPYTGCAIGEEWMEAGKDVLIVYDDLSKHAVAYRALSLLLARPPGREAYPGDVFYLHSRLLERAACMSDEYGGGTMTALPIIETQAGDIAAYIPTNVISITDGQIYLEAELFNRGTRPAINAGFSVSRVGGAAQIKAMKDLSGTLRVELAQYRELAAFSQYGSDLNQDTRDRLDHGERIVEVFKQVQYNPIPVERQVVALFMLANRFFTDVPIEKVGLVERGFMEYMDENYAEVMDEIRSTGNISSEAQDSIKVAYEAFTTLP